MNLLGHSDEQAAIIRRLTDESRQLQADLAAAQRNVAKWQEKVAAVNAAAGAVALTDEQWARVLDLLHRPVPPGPTKDLDVAIIRSITSQRGR